MIKLIKLIFAIEHLVLYFLTCYNIFRFPGNLHWQTLSPVGPVNNRINVDSLQDILTYKLSTKYRNVNILRK